MLARSLYAGLALAWLVVQLYIRYVTPINPLPQRFLFVVASFLLLFFPFGAASAAAGKGRGRQILEYALFALSAALGVYLWTQTDRYVNRWEFVDPVFAGDVAFTLVLILLMLILTHRAAGPALPVFTLAMLAYGFVGKPLPGIFNHPGMSLTDMAEVQLMGGQGVFGIAAGVCVDFIFYFIVFGAVYEAFGGGDLLTKCGMIFTKRTVGGEAKAEVVASAFMGTVSGSAVANVVSTGTFTIPLMKKAGFKPEVAAAVESSSSTGGQIMPPVMGAGAFIMAEALGVPYLEVCKAAILPALLYFTAIFFFVHYYAKQHTFGTSDLDVSWWDILARFHLMIPLGLLIYFIAAEYSLGMSVLYSLASLVAIGSLSRRTRPGITAFLDSLVDGMKQSASVGVPIFICGVSVGIAIYTGIAAKATNVIVGLGQGSLLPSLLLGVLVTIVLGMGMPTVAAYVVGSLFVVSALTKQGIPPIAAHMFIFYYAVLGQVTPPVAMAAYTAAGIAGSSPLRTGWIAFLLCLPGFLIPFSFVYDPSLLLQGPWWLILYAFMKTAVGCYFLALSLTGYEASGRIAGWQMHAYRVLLILAAIFMISPSVMMDVAGLAIGCLMLGISRVLTLRSRRMPPAPPAPATDAVKRPRDLPV
jgi:TRAP transporter 4TM/12TM fusion protein